MTLHHLNDVNEDARTAECSLCGKVDIHKTRVSVATGNQLWSCSGKLTSRKHVHRLSSIDPEAKTAICASCGPVRIVKNGNYKGKTLWKCKIKRLDFDRSDGRKQYLDDYTKTDEYIERHKIDTRRNWLKRYGLTPDDYDRMLEAQGHVCAICHKPDPTQDKLAVDHDHETGRTRGLLCYACNTGIAKFDEVIENLESAIAYLKDHKGREKLAWLME